ncbi:MAGa3780 family membrane protein [Mycoplasma sp. Mirounga ES2805-ORL]|uniref:MAGa3780 family membrane protein n=1 Tax=Mycoplasma sp. Mirounga ES2805-ORL TaxID=754514 RepID=UPI00197BAE81|nr:hypothetical protein [Mycoplasma sp. Mirounga ES2805-ORL]QSF13559.1 hypothetical protein JXZ90_02715 [Mycoplasma sp. Mirounga ES2805-ORL]
MENKCILKKCPLGQKLSGLSKEYKIMFFLGIWLLLVDTAILIYYFYHNISLVKMFLEENSIKDFNGINGALAPSALAIMWKITLTFTQISNWFLAVMLTIHPFHKDSKKSQSFLFAAIVYITITFLIYWGLISWNASTWKYPLVGICSTILHAINPIIGFVAFILIRKNINISQASIWKTNIFVLVYFMFGLITFLIGEQLVSFARQSENVFDKYRIMDVAIYKFLNFRHPLFYKGNNMFVVVLLDIAMFILGFVLSPAIGYCWAKILKLNVTKCCRTQKDNECVIK